MHRDFPLGRQQYRLLVSNEGDNAACDIVTVLI